MPLLLLPNLTGPVYGHNKLRRQRSLNINQQDTAGGAHGMANVGHCPAPEKARYQLTPAHYSVVYSKITSSTNRIEYKQ